MPALPSITVIVAVFNGAATLARCLDSVAAQTYPRTELIVIDGGSTDGTTALLEERRDRIAYWVSEPDRGIYHAWNKGLERATGDWICFLGADDYLWSETVLERLATPLASVPAEVRVVYGQAAIVSPSGQVIRYDGRPWAEAQREMAWSLSLPHPGLLHHRSLFERWGGFDESFQVVGDYELLLRELKGGRAEFVPDVVVAGFQHGGVSHSPRMMSTMLREIGRARRKNGIGGWAALRPTPTRIKMLLCALTFRLIGDQGFRALADGYRRMTRRPVVWR